MMNQDELSEKLVEVDSRSKSNKHRLDTMEKRQGNLEQLTNAFSVMQKEQEYIKEDVGEIKADVKILAEKPAKRWESVVDRVIMAIIGIVVGYLVSGGQLP